MHSEISFQDWDFCYPENKLYISYWTQRMSWIWNLNAFIINKWYQWYGKVQFTSWDIVSNEFWAKCTLYLTTYFHLQTNTPQGSMIDGLSRICIKSREISCWTIWLLLSIQNADLVLPEYSLMKLSSMKKEKGDFRHMYWDLANCCSTSCQHTQDFWDIKLGEMSEKDLKGLKATKRDH